MISLILDVVLAISIFGIYCWRLDALRSIMSTDLLEPTDKFKGLLGLYSLLIMASVTRIIFGFLLTKSYQRLKAYGYTIPSAFCLLFGIVLAAAFNDTAYNFVGQSVRLWEAELPIGIITIFFNLVFLTVGSRIVQRGNVDSLL